MINVSAIVIGGKLPPSVHNDIRTFLKGCEGRYVDLTLKKASSKRSLPQNRYYFSGVIPIVKEAFKDLGHQLTSAEVHEFLADKFHSVEMMSKDGEVIGRKRLKTSTMTKTQFADYIERIAQFAAEILNVEIPPPMTQVQMNYEN